MKKYYIYLIRIEGTNTCKIGYTKESKGPLKRMEELQTGCPFKLEYVDAYLTEFRQVEHILHRKFVTKKTTEDDVELLGEWFNLDDQDVIDFSDQCKITEENIRVITENSTLDDPFKYI